MEKHLLLFDFNIVIVIMLGKICFTGIFSVWNKRHDRRRMDSDFKTIQLNYLFQHVVIG